MAAPCPTVQTLTDRAHVRLVRPDVMLTLFLLIFTLSAMARTECLRGMEHRTTCALPRRTPAL